MMGSGTVVQYLSYQISLENVKAKMNCFYLGRPGFTQHSYEDYSVILLHEAAFNLLHGAIGTLDIDVGYLCQFC